MTSLTDNPLDTGMRNLTWINLRTYKVTPLTPRVKPCVIQSFLTFDSVDRTLKCYHLFHWKAVEQYFTVVLFVFQVCNFVKFINFGLGTVRSESQKVKQYYKFFPKCTFQMVYILI